MKLKLRSTTSLRTLILLCTAVIAFMNVYHGFTLRPSLSTLTDEGFQLDLDVESNLRTLHVVKCLAGNSSAFIDEWEFGFKSILVNAPLDSNLHVHIIADADATKAIHERIEKNKLTESVWRNEVTVTVNNVEDLLPSWRSFLTQSLTNESNRNWMDRRVGIGAYFRLFAHRVIMPYECKDDTTCTDFKKRDLEEAVYMDTDVVIIANLNHLIHTTEKTLVKAKEEGLQRPIWIWNLNSGFIVLDLTRFEQMWELVAKMPSIANNDERKKGDQWLLAKVQEKHTNVAAKLPDEWSTHVGHGFRREPQKLLDSGRDAGMLHFTAPDSFGANFMDRGGTDKWCHRSKGCKGDDTAPGSDMDKVRRSWGLAEYYAKLSWDWAFYQGGRSRLRPGEEGHVLQYVKRISRPEEL